MEKVKLVKIDDCIHTFEELHIFESFAAMALGTSEWNTFRTH